MATKQEQTGNDKLKAKIEDKGVQTKITIEILKYQIKYLTQKLLDEVQLITIK
jgi:hypothetical protein